jgi:YrbI family 3-deoxy-D-manno-octulosonate 8-phosphate phosphatase
VSEYGGYVTYAQRNPVVSARAAKLKVPVVYGEDNKEEAFGRWTTENGLRVEKVIYLGNDLNDLDCMRLAGYSVAVADAHPSVLQAADMVLSRRGGRGAVRELCEMILISAKVQP